MFFVAILGWILTLITGRLPVGLHRFFVRVHPLRHAPHRVPDARREPVSAVQRRARRLSVDVDLPSEPERAVALADALPAAPRDPGAPAQRRVRRTPVASRTGARAARRRRRRHRVARRRAVRRRVPRLVREPRDGTDAARPARHARLRHRLPGSGLAYLLLVTDRYPNADPRRCSPTVEPPPLHVVHIARDADDLRRSRVTVLFRLPLAIPHLVWLALWGLLAFFASIVQWFVSLVRATPAGGAASLHQRVDPLLHPRLGVPERGVESVPGLHRCAGHVSARSGAAGARPPEPLEDRVPRSSSRSPALDRLRRRSARCSASRQS